MKGVMAMFVTTRSLQRDPVINRIFDVLGSLNGDSTQASWVPPADIFEGAEGIRIIAELPGVKPEDVKIRLMRSEEHTSELQSLAYLLCRLLLEKKSSSHPSR